MMDPNDLAKIVNSLAGLLNEEENKEPKVSLRLTDLAKITVGIMHQRYKKNIPHPQPTLYGIDFKITPEGEVKLVEVNGANSGTGGFRDIYGDNRVREEIIARMRDLAGGKRIVISGSYAKLRQDHFRGLPKGRTDKRSLIRRAWDSYLNSDKLRIMKYIIESETRRKISKEELDSEKKNVEFLWKGEFRRTESEDCELLSDAYFIHDWDNVRILYEKDTTLITRINCPVLDAGGEQIADHLHSEDIGLFWDRLGKYFGSMYPGFAVVNPAHHACIVRNKLYVHHALQDTHLSESLIPSLPIGLGLETREQYDLFMQTHDNELFVVKPVDGSRGYGVQIVGREEVLAQQDTIGNPICKSLSIEEAWDRLPRGALMYLNCGINFLSPYVQSKRIQSARTGMDHDGCMRAIVFNGEFIDAYWRLSPAPLDSNAKLEDRLRANRSRGATAQEPTDQEKLIAKEFSEVIVHELDQYARAFSNIHDSTMEHRIWAEILGKKHGVKPKRKPILRAAKKRRKELDMYPISFNQLRTLRRGAICGLVSTGTVGLYNLLQHLI